MKNLKYITLGIVTVALAACTKTEFDDFEPTSGGSADFTNYVAVGNSLTQGYQDGGLHNEYNQQDNSFPAIIAKQMGTGFNQPTVYGDGSGYKKLVNLAPTMADVPPVSGWNNWSQSENYNNLGVAGIKLSDCVAPFNTSNPYQSTLTSLNPYGAFMDLSTKSYLDNVKTTQATFYTCWLGNNDVLAWATNGGYDTTIVPGIGKVNNAELTPVTEFKTKYDLLLDAFQQMGAKGVCATLPDVTSIPFFTTVPYNPVPLDQATAHLLMYGPSGNGSDGFLAYNAGLDQALGGGYPGLTAAEVAKRKINYTASETNSILIMDESLTDLTPLNPALVSMRPANAQDLILLTASSDIGRPLSPTDIYGVSVPFADTLVLTAAEILEVQNHTNQLNSQIQLSASAHGVAVVDMYSYMFKLQSGMTFDGVDYTASYIEGGGFSLDGVHPNTRGYAIIANKFIEVINATYGSNLKPVSVQNYRGIIFP